MTVAEYNQREQLALSSAPARLAQMVGTLMFDAERYPSRVAAETELWKYADAMHETRLDSTFNRLFGGALSSEEFELLQQAVGVARVACDDWTHTITPRGSMLRALLLWRHLSPLAGTSKRIFEIGPGSGHLGTLLMLSGWQYGATENAQGFFLWQQQLWRTANLTPVCHLPWWEFYGLTLPKLPKVNVVTCNHALAEMHPFALAFALGAARAMLEPDGVFAFEGWGYERFHSRASIEGEFARFGFVRVQDNGYLTVFARSPRHVPQPKPKRDISKSELDAYYSTASLSPDERLLALLGMNL